MPPKENKFQKTVGCILLGEKVQTKRKLINNKIRQFNPWIEKKTWSIKEKI